jgi:hypothetical protein
MGDGPRTNYVLAVPDIEEFRLQCEQISDWVRKTLNLYWFLIDKEGEITAISPRESVSGGDIAAPANPGPLD